MEAFKKAAHLHSSCKSLHQIQGFRSCLAKSQSARLHTVSEFACYPLFYRLCPPLRRADRRPSPAATPVPKF